MKSLEREPPVHTWPEGTVQMRANGVAMVVDGDGIPRGFFAIKGSSLKYAERLREKPSDREQWREVIELWASFPSWVRAKVREVMRLG